MSPSKIESILKEIVEGNEAMEKLKDHFHAVEREIDGMVEDPEADLDKILDRAKVLVKRVFESDYNFFAKNWSEIEKEIKKNLIRSKKVTR